RCRHDSRRCRNRDDRSPRAMHVKGRGLPARGRFQVKKLAIMAVVTEVIVVTAQLPRAHADPRANAEKYFRAGAQAYSAQNFAAAAQDFDEAYKAMPIPEIAFSAAQAYRKLYRVEPKAEYVKRSVELYRAYLEKVKSGGRVGDAADSL